MFRWRVARCGLIVLLVTSTGFCRFINSYAGPYLGYVKRMYDCYEEFVIPGLKVHLRFSNFNRFKPFEKQMVTGNLTFYEDLDDSYSVTVRWAKWSNNQWKKNYLVLNRLRGQSCTTLRENMPHAYRAAFKHAKMSGPCSMLKGTYVYNAVPFDWTMPNFPVLPYGQYLINFTAFRSGSHRMFTACTEVELVPKP